ncbi:MAG: hypothetical protein CMI86_00445 [Candidatus Pelagibacter sp.]|nr:hypothetical protein [Candidatus Pelagibacter sp.]|tara:strand:- start:5326 stop:5511 length:186 start_codon:yes stop_codon:yes gene_type:complete
MQFQKKTSIGNLSSISKLFIKLAILISLIFLAVLMIDRINFPKPINSIETIIPNEKIKIIK